MPPRGGGLPRRSGTVVAVPAFGGGGREGLASSDPDEVRDTGRGGSGREPTLAELSVRVGACREGGPGRLSVGDVELRGRLPAATLPVAGGGAAARMGRPVVRGGGTRGFAAASLTGFARDSPSLFTGNGGLAPRATGGFGRSNDGLPAGTAGLLTGGRPLGNGTDTAEEVGRPAVVWRRTGAGAAYTTSSAGCPAVAAWPSSTLLSCSVRTWHARTSVSSCSPSQMAARCRRGRCERGE